MKIEYSLNNDGILNIKLEGNYLSYVDNEEQSGIYDTITSKNVKEIIIDSSKLEKWDSTLVVVFYKILKIVNTKNIKINLDTLPIGFQRLLRLAFSSNRKMQRQNLTKKNTFLERVGERTINRFESFFSGFSFFVKMLKSLFRFFFGSAVMRTVDFISALGDCGYKALPIVSLISFMVGLILAFVGAVQLKVFGAQIYVASLVAIGMVRIMGPAMAGIIMAGRTGASYSATIGTMQVNDEINALRTMGIPIMDFLTLPRFLALTIAMPILSMIADILGIIGGASVGTTMLGIPFQEYWKLSIDALSLKNFLIGIFHGYVYGWVISLCGCYYGINCGKDADSVGKATTSAVVASIVWIVIMTGIITFICEVFGI